MTSIRRRFPVLESIYFFGSAATVHLAAQFIGYPIQLDGRSMNPTLQSGEFVWVNTFTRWLFTEKCERGQVGIFWSPKEKNHVIIKRVVAKEGDRVIPRDGREAVTIPKGHCWIEGDNEATSVDSNSYGPVSMSLFIGRAVRWDRRLTKENYRNYRVTAREKGRDLDG
eukprot:TRINITY_DN12507_c0_g1_i1.p1 TRINITY_DN12507_c0_g1~~TRINITY_DN12507_c0_g1_i1.p1  ORF type:complete len:168 (+),score=20.53 TRINITY_DN12507_c0_g1_i1:101-604(+)